MRYLLVVFVLLAACHSRKPKTAAAPEKDRIVFLVLKLAREPQQEHSQLSLVSRTEAEGTLKDMRKEQFGGNSYLSIKIYRRDSLVDSMTMEHPLYKRVEFLDDSSRFVSRQLSLMEAEFTLRLAVKGNSSELRITEVLDKKTRYAFTPIKL